MKKIILAALLTTAATSANAAVLVNFQGGASAAPTGVVVVENFDSLVAGSALGSNGQVFAASVANGAARPAFNSTGNFGAVLGDPTDGSWTINFDATNLLTFVIGSVDTYNTLTLLFEDATSQAYVGGQIINDLSFPSGDQISGETNGRVKYTVTGGGPRIVGATFQSSENSFEFDNIAIGAVPEASTWAMMLVGFAAIGASLRRRSSQAKISFA